MSIFRNIALLRLAGWGALLLIALATVHGILVPRGVWLDFANFYDAGSKALIGETVNLYDEFAKIGGEDPFGNMAFFSAPISSYFYAPLAALAPDPAIIAFKVASAIAIYAGLFLLFRHYRRLIPADPLPRAMYFAGFCVAALLFHPFWTVFQVGGQTTPFVFLMFVIGLIAYERGHYPIVALLYVPMVLIKPAFGLAALILFIVSPMRFRLTALIGGGVAVLVSILVIGLDVHLEFLTFLSVKSGELAPAQFNANLFGWIDPLLLDRETYGAIDDTPPDLRLIGTVARLVVLIGIGVFIWATLGGDLPDRAARGLVYMVAMLASLVVTPVVWGHYLMLLFPIIVHALVFSNRLPVFCMILIGLAVCAGVIQNLWILNKVIEIVGIDTKETLLMVSVARSASMALITLAVLGFARSLIATGRAPEWTARAG